MNRLVLSATVAERAALRYTPAGLPALDLVLAHESQVEQEGGVRKVSMQLRALAVGSLVGALERVSFETRLRFGGFLAPARNGRGLLFHLTDLEPEA